MNRIFKSLNINYSIDNFNVRNGELVVDRVFLRSRTLDALIECNDIVYNLGVNKYFDLETIIRNYLYQSNYLIFMVHKGKKYVKSIKPKDKTYYEKYKHFLLIGMNKKDLLDLEDDDVMVKKIKEEVVKLNSDPKFYQFLTVEEDKEILCNSYYSKGIKEGINKGIEQEKIINAKRMKKENIANSIISKVTGLDINTITSL